MNKAQGLENNGGGKIIQNKYVLAYIFPLTEGKIHFYSR